MITSRDVCTLGRHANTTSTRDTKSAAELAPVAPLAAQEVFDLFVTLRRSGVTILLVEQNVRQALAIADRGYVIESGRIILEGDSPTLLADEGLARAYLGIERQ